MAAKPRRPEAELKAEAQAYEDRYGHLDPRKVIERAATDLFVGDIAAVSSFGADSAVLLHMVAEVDRSLPIVFLDTGKHFEETIRYRDDILSDLGLTDLRIVSPEEAALSRDDPDGMLHARDTEACCAVRKVEPMARGVEPFAAWFTGRKRFQAATRSALPVFETVGPRFRINPLARWDGEALSGYLERHGLRANPLVAYGYLSIGCFPCTQPVQPGEDPRSGRWAGQAKTECGIHLGGLEATLNTSSR